MKQKRILVTGAGSGFGREVALRLAARGHRTIAGVRGAGQAADLREEAGRRGVPLRVKPSTSPSPPIANAPGNGISTCC